MYSIADYCLMLADRQRSDAYSNALRQAITPGCIVIDIGTGTGAFAMLACRYGASHVYAIDPSETIQVGKEMAAANGLANQITFIQDLSTNVDLPEPADVIFADLRGVVPLYEHHIEALADAQQRLLAPDGVLIPQRDTIWIAPIEDAKLYDRCVRAWGDQDFGLDLSLSSLRLANQYHKVHLHQRALLAAPQQFVELDYTQRHDPNVHATLAWHSDRAGRLYGFGMWFETQLLADIGFSSAPGQPEMIYGQAFFPLEHPITINVHERINLSMQATLIQRDYVWRWHTTAGNQQLSQSTFMGEPMPLESMRKRAADYVPTLNEVGQTDLLILQLMLEGHPLAEIADQVCQMFPASFSSAQEALARVGEMAVKYG